MKTTSTILVFALLAAVTVASGVAEGFLSGRWDAVVESNVEECVASVPKHFGEWTLDVELPISDAVLEMLQCQVYLNRVYRNETTGDRVSIALLIGPSGPIAVHTPEICYSSRDFDIVSEPKRTTIGEAGEHASTLWTVTFRQSNLDASLLRVMYGWTDDGTWYAASEPRISYAMSPLLYKIQMAGHPPLDLSDDARDPCQSFADEFIPLLNRALFKNPAGAP